MDRENYQRARPLGCKIIQNRKYQIRQRDSRGAFYHQKNLNRDHEGPQKRGFSGSATPIPKEKASI
jgi:hypothetical protein